MSARDPGPASVGGKASGLARLEVAGARVPSFAVVDTEDFAAHLARCGLEEPIERGLHELSELGASAEFARRAERLAAQVEEQLLAQPLGPELSARLAAQLEAWGDAPVAVRSSMVGEDSAGASFAGQLESFLFQRGVQEVATAVRRCWASAFAPRVLLYRLHREGRLHAPAMGVVVQEMILGQVSGVIFTAHPVTGRRDHALLTAAWGVGEGIVSGVCNTDEHVWEHGRGEVACEVAAKDLQLLPRADGGAGTEEVAVPPALQRERCLNPEQLRAVCEEALRVAAALGAPQDIEWTLRDGEVWLLQARPITSLPPAPRAAAPRRPAGAAAENGDAPEIVFDNSNIQESYCGVTTPLTFSFASEAYASVYEQTMRAAGLSEAVIAAHRPILRNLLGLVRGRVYYNINNWYRGLLLLPSFGRNKADMEAMMGLEEPVDLVQDHVLSAGEKLRRLPGMLRTLLALTRQFRRLPRAIPAFLRDFQAAYERVDRSVLPGASFSELMRQLDHLRTRMVDRWHVPIINDFYVMMSTGRLRRLLGEESTELFAALLGGEEGIESTEPTKLLMRLAAQARSSPGLAELLAKRPGVEVLERLRAEHPDFAARVDDYIEHYGDRCMGELKLETRSLREDPTFVFEVLCNFIARPDLDDEELRRRERGLREEAEQTLRSGLGWLGRLRSRRILARARESVRNRENVRLARTRMFGLYRDVYRALGQRLHEVGRLDEARDVFYLTTEELRAYHEGRSVNVDLAAIARMRKQEFQAYEAEDLPHQFRTRGPVYHGNRFEGPRSAAVDKDARVLQGTGCYPGVVEAPLRVILSPRDEMDVGGRILCTVRTDPGWAPLFPTSAGILVERGSSLSHSAVVARELGIPAVVGVPGLLQVVADGERVRLDGGSGRVERLDAQPARDA